MTNPNNITTEQQPGVRKHSQTFIAQISSPLPPPEMLVGYEKAQPGLINKIIELAELEGVHRRELEKEKLCAEIKSMQAADILISKAQNYSLIISLVMIVAGVLAGVMGAQITGSIIGTSGVVSIIAAYLKYSRR